MNQESAAPVPVTWATALPAIVGPAHKKYQRTGWNGKGLYVQMHGSVRATDVELPNGVQPYIEPFFVIVNTLNGTVNTWVPSVSDQMGHDWVEYIPA